MLSGLASVCPTDREQLSLVTRDIERLSAWCWASLADARPAPKRQRPNVSLLLERVYNFVGTCAPVGSHPCDNSSM